MNRTWETNKPPLKSPRLTAIFSQKIPIRFSHKSHHEVIHAQMEAPRAASSRIKSPGFLPAPPLSLSLSLFLWLILPAEVTWTNKNLLSSFIIEIVPRPPLAIFVVGQRIRERVREREEEEENTGFLEEESGLGIHLKNSVTGSQWKWFRWPRDLNSFTRNLGCGTSRGVTGVTRSAGSTTRSSLLVSRWKLYLHSDQCSSTSRFFVSRSSSRF